MNNFLIRKLVREFLLLEENQMDLFNNTYTGPKDYESEYQDWLKDFKAKILNSDIEETVFKNILLKVPNSYKVYKEIDWPNYKYEINGRNGSFYRKPIDIINFFSGKQHNIGNRFPSVLLKTLTDFENRTILDKPQDQTDVKINFNISQSVIGAKCTNYLTSEQIKNALAKGANGEYLVAAILGDEDGKTVTSRNALWDIEINGKKFEVKDASKGPFWTGKSGRENAKRFINDISTAINELNKFISRVEGSQLSELFDAKDVLSQIDKTSLESLKNGEIKNLGVIKENFLKIRNLKLNYLSNLSSENDNNLSIQFSTLNGPINVPQNKKELYYLTVNYLEKNLSLNSNFILKQEEKIDYIKSIFSVLNHQLFNFKNVNPIDQMIELLKDPDKNFNSEITGLFVLKDLSSEIPKIYYFPRSSIKNHLEYERVSKYTVKFKLK